MSALTRRLLFVGWTALALVVGILLANSLPNGEPDSSGAHQRRCRR